MTDTLKLLGKNAQGSEKVEKYFPIMKLETLMNVVHVACTSETPAIEGMSLFLL